MEYMRISDRLLLEFGEDDPSMLSPGEWEAASRQVRAHRFEESLREGRKSFFWLARRLGLPVTFDLASMVREIEVDGSAALYYEPRLIEKKSGGTRVIITPKPDLMFVQTRINTLLQRTFRRPDNVFGYRGGSCVEVARRHASWPSTLKFDVQNAFFQVRWGQVYEAIRRPGKDPNAVGFGGYVARWISKLCSYSPIPNSVAERFPSVTYSFLPQGAPTSPICFDLACGRLDRKLGRVAKRVGGIVSRYADNYYFSMPTPEISEKLERMVVCDARNRGFPVHKVQRVSEGELCRILGYNITDGKITNKRDFHRNLRGALYVLKTRLDRGLEWEAAYARVRGYMGLSINLPEQLQQTYAYCAAKIAEL